MAQTIEANIKFEVPEDKVLVDRIEWQETQEKAYAHEIWDKEELRLYLKKPSNTWINDHVLANPRLRDELNELRKKGALKGGGKGSTWLMFADDMKQFIADNKEIIMEESK
ncbi:DUF771 domain-containing protein [Pediococcus claussenii]|uniref:DUF771 domain-containing protein n=1 Tax=Pediococcus claussenii TaxID=187452 RepID=UPI00081A36FE|nr:DUF771 domain-containing protein [Pediococcus claussenii]ANZ70346.1 hypothetical protein AYR57_08470 [Pediococcus claussenii]ANZ72162.1 hypothetical protein AYR58_08470 [Pediococcus claussenii]